MADGPHPAARILLWCGWAVAAERAAMPQLLFLAVAAATAFLLLPVRIGAWRLLRRTRWLMAVLLLTYAYTLPGDAAWPALGWASPGLAGLAAGSWRVGRLVLLLVGLAVLLAYTPRPRLLAALYGLALPFTWLGLDRRAFAVRLGLTLDYVEQAPPAAGWREMLRAAPADPGAPTVFALPLERWRLRDTAFILAGLVGLGMALV